MQVDPFNRFRNIAQPNHIFFVARSNQGRFLDDILDIRRDLSTPYAPGACIDRASYLILLNKIEKSFGLQVGFS